MLMYIFLLVAVGILFFMMFVNFEKWSDKTLNRISVAFWYCLIAQGLVYIIRFVHYIFDAGGVTSCLR